MPIKNGTVYDRDAIRAFVIFHVIKTKKLRILLSLAFGLAGLGLCIWGVCRRGLSSSYTILGVRLLLLFVALACRWFLEPILRYKNEVGSWEVAISYEFYSKDFVARSTRVDANRSSGVHYSALESVCETGEYIYLYPNPANAFIVRKAGFSTENLQALRALLLREVDDHRLHLKREHTEYGGQK